ncbi:MAG TPA: tRNA (cytidine(34)-2'-O)-methyltransferase [Leptospiraceae bacterium]|nr:tRNA (cytidine(34)-2'-O)-methyltransferase [Leptospirales bacterium]HMU82451.1 tRNA (cytidine(34)-2'-O)-methyltransferase [Leptospiraceae bacterium]HMW61315.1 tRNA (cytidine(34)-2'-O)-methyltransferase [Leptospiraceae bacterium]HMX55910.1 tRNA (cytidine(34)-2'-O)-methyltransferase [Leptospiraceae bacterium]HMZ35729.1 tRNA (cytidine(34)-2'-O)-methyltransferase [Leptospiraceae bacterium]
MHIALYRPEIPPNTGNIARLAVCTDTPLHIVGEPSFSMDEKAVRRAGLDYWAQLDLKRHADYEEFYASLASIGVPLVAFSRFATDSMWDFTFSGQEALLFGQETAGLPQEITEHVRKHGRLLRIPVGEKCRSLNLSNSVAIACYEVFRQNRRSFSWAL